MPSDARRLHEALDDDRRADERTVGNSRPWEPELTNKLFFHKDHPGAFQVEWLATNKGSAAPDSLYFNVVGIDDVTNAQGHFQHTDLDHGRHVSAGPQRLMHGTWISGDSAGMFIVKMSHSRRAICQIRRGREPPGR